MKYDSTLLRSNILLGQINTKKGYVWYVTTPLHKHTMHQDWIMIIMSSSQKRYTTCLVIPYGKSKAQSTWLNEF